MVHIIVDVTKSGGYYSQQIGGGQEGYGLPYPVPIHEGFRFQRGFGARYRQMGHGVLSNVFSRVYRYLIPLLKRAGTSVAPLAKEALGTLATQGAVSGAQALNEIAAGKSPKEAVKTHATRALRELAGKTGRRLQQFSNVSQEGGSGARRSGRKRKTITNLHLLGKTILESAAKKRRRNTSFTTF